MKIQEMFNDDVKAVKDIINNLPEVGVFEKYWSYVDTPNDHLNIKFEKEYHKELRNRRFGFLKEIFENHYKTLDKEELIKMQLVSIEHGYSSLFDDDDYYIIEAVNDIYTSSELYTFIKKEMEKVLEFILDRANQNEKARKEHERQQKIESLKRDILARERHNAEDQEKLAKLLGEE